MSIDALRNNLARMKEIVREMFIFTNHLDNINSLEASTKVVIDTREKKLLKEVISSLEVQLKILNNSFPELVESLGVYKKLTTEPNKADVSQFGKNLVQVKYAPTGKEKISLIISDREKKEFLENLSKSSMSIEHLKKRYSIEKSEKTEINIGKPNFFAIMANKLFRNYSNNLISKGYFENLNRDLRKINSPFLVGTYVSIFFLSILISFFSGVVILIFLLFFNLGIDFPFVSMIPENESILFRFVKFFWIAIALPLFTGFLVYFYPKGESKNIGSKIDQELPFVTIHMSAIASSGVEPMTIFKIILKSGEYKYTNSEFRKLMNLVNFQGKDLVSALKTTSRTSSSSKLKELLDGMATSITSGGSLTQFLNKHAENLLFDYKLEREKNTKSSETFMDIYISIAIAAPMILLMLLVIMGSTGTLSNVIGLSVEVLSLLIILAITFLNIGFLIFLRIKQPVI